MLKPLTHTQYDRVWRSGLWEVVTRGYESGGGHDEISTLLRRNTQEGASLPTLRVHGGKTT